MDERGDDDEEEATVNPTAAEGSKTIDNTLV